MKSHILGANLVGLLLAACAGNDNAATPIYGVGGTGTSDVGGIGGPVTGSTGASAGSPVTNTSAGFTSATSAVAGATTAGAQVTTGGTPLTTNGVVTNGVVTNGVVTNGSVTNGAVTNGSITNGSTDGTLGGTDGTTGFDNTTGATDGTTGSGNTMGGNTGAGGGTSSNTVNTSANTSNTSAASTTGGNTDDWYPCNGDTSGYDVVVVGSGNSWTVNGGGSYGDMASAMSAGYGQLSGTTKQAMLVQGDGNIDADAQLKMPSNIILNICGTINVTGTATQSDRSPLYARDRTNIDIPHARITGNAQYGMFFRSVSNIHLGEIEIDLNINNSGLGIRIDNNPSGGGAKVTNIQIDHVTVTSGGHGVETYGVDGINIGRVDGIDTGNCGLILNNTSNAEVGTVHCENCAHIGTGYAAFRIANNAGKIGNDWPAGNIHVGEVYARNGGRGIFSVSGSGGLTIDRIDIANTGNNAILLQNCINTTIAAESGTVSNGSVVLSNDTTNTNNGTFEASRNVTLQNLTLSNGATLSEAWCDLGDRGNRASNISGATANMCF